jgi:BarA-like signal transduction histidine kinase
MAEELNERDFIKALAMPREIEGLAVTNEHSESPTELIHPLAYSENPRTHPDMILVPTCYKIKRNLKEKFDELKAI